MLIFAFLQLEVLPEAVEVVNAPEAPKNKERRRKRKQEVLEPAVEATPTQGSPDKSFSKRKTRSHKDSKPNNAQSCVGDNVSKVIIELHLIRVDLDSFILCQKYILISKHFSGQSIEHSNADTSQQEQLPSTNLLEHPPLLRKKLMLSRVLLH